jgi:hypothetical protein
MIRLRPRLKTLAGTVISPVLAAAGKLLFS